MTDLKRLQALELEAEAEKAEAEAEEAALNLHERLASQFELRQYLFDGVLDYETIAGCIEELDFWARLDADKVHKSIRLVLNGSSEIIQALALHDKIRWLQQAGFRVTVEVAGVAGEQAILILQAADHRTMTARSWLEVQEIESSFHGNTYVSERELEWLVRMEKQQCGIMAARSKLSAEQIAARIKLKPWRLSAQDALENGLIDEISEVRPTAMVSAVVPIRHELPEAKTAKQRKIRAEILKLRAESSLKRLDDQIRKASASYNGAVRFINQVDVDSVADAKSDFTEALRLSDRPIELLIDSNGGSCLDGFGFIDLVEQTVQSGRIVNTEVLGFAASMGGVMLQVGVKRTMGKNAWLLIHRVSDWFSDRTSRIKLDHKNAMQVQRQCFELLASRSVMTADEILTACRDHDWWLSADEALALGFIDEIR